jgi:hypothetical protein
LFFLVNKNVKRLALNCLSNSNRQSNSSAENLIYQLTNLTMNPKSSENLFQNQILTISINSNNRCQIVRYSNGKYFIPCFELSRILNINENAIDKETVRPTKTKNSTFLFNCFYLKMFSRIRIYQSNDLFNIFKNVNNSCQHSMNCHRPYVFLLLISSIIPVLKMSKYMNQYHEIVLAFEQLLMMEIESNKK